MLFVYYPRCSTCQKAKKWLDEHDIEYEEKDIVKDNPQYDDLKDILLRNSSIQAARSTVKTKSRTSCLI